MKNSGIEWQEEIKKEIPFIESIPEDWTLIPNRWLFKEDGKKVGIDWSKYQLLSLTTTGVKERNIDDVGGKVPTSYESYQTVKKGQMVFCLFDLDCSAVFSGISKYDGMITSAYDVFSATDLITNNYIDYWFRYVFSNRYYMMYSKNIRYSVTSDIFKGLKTPVPPKTVQQKIAEILDEKCGKIDKLIENEQKQIEKMKEYKQSVITSAVTKGLDKSAPMKDSEDWMEKIPVHWLTPKIKYYALVESGGTPNRNHEEYWNGNINWVKTGELQNTELYEAEEKITQEAIDNSSAKVFPVDTILVAMYGQGKTRGMTALLKKESATNQACAGIQLIKKGFYVKYLWWCLMGAYDSLRERANGSGQPNLSGTLISDFCVTMPPLQEQLEIVDYLEKKTKSIDEYLLLKQRKIEKLQEYKKSLIYEYVTGKKKVV